MQPTETPADGAARVPAAAVAMAISAVLLWSSAIVVGRWIHQDIPAFGLTFWRCVIAVLVLLPFSWRHVRADLPAIRRRWRLLAVLAAAMWTVGSASMFYGLHYTEAVNAGLLNATEPAGIVLIAWLLYRDTVTARQAVGIAISFSGVGVLILGGHEGEVLALGPRIGDLLVLLAVVSWSFYVVLFHRFGREMHPMTMLFAVMAFAVPELLPLYLVESALVRPVPVDPASIGAIVYLSLASSLLAVLCWNRAILGMGHARAGLFTHLMPVFTVLLAMAFLGERLQAYHLAGVVLIGIGLWLTTAARRPRH